MNRSHRVHYDPTGSLLINLVFLLDLVDILMINLVSLHDRMMLAMISWLCNNVYDWTIWW